MSLELARDRIEYLAESWPLGISRGSCAFDGFLAAAAKTIDETAEPLPYAIG
ncbi:hypothetical protein [Marichromatium sp. AB31]|uniref:hypothetical protein n=1 Tax=Marichromatium sp. AB31 TaxID=2483362 RepID=UPI0016802A63|nr:hypothetical protein [Marichromatium sp. AB31]